MDLLIISPIHTSHAIYYSQYLFLLNMWQIAINVNLILKILLFLENECLIFYKIVHFLFNTLDSINYTNFVVYVCLFCTVATCFKCDKIE